MRKKFRGRGYKLKSTMGGEKTLKKKKKGRKEKETQGKGERKGGKGHERR